MDTLTGRWAHINVKLLHSTFSISAEPPEGAFQILLRPFYPWVVDQRIIIIWRGLFPARSQILERRLYLTLSEVCPKVVRSLSRTLSGLVRKIYSTDFDETLYIVYWYGLVVPHLVWRQLVPHFMSFGRGGGHQK